MTQLPVAEGIFTMPPEEPTLIGGKCDDCGLITFPQQSACARCGSTATAAQKLGRRGTLWAWTIQAFQPPSPPYSGPQGVDFVPYGIGVVEIPGEVRVESRLTVNDPDVLRNGMPVELVLVPFGTDADGNEQVTFAFAPVEEGN
jgi:uncharacterized OB-fold protein